MEYHPYVEPYKRPIDMDNPYKHQPSETLDSRDYWKARRGVAEVCQDLSLSLDRGRLRMPPVQLKEIKSLISQCTPDDMEWDAFSHCQEMGVAVGACPITELLFLDATFLRMLLH